MALVRLATRRALPLRVRGAAHSIPPAIYSDARLSGNVEAVDVVLDRYARMTFDDERMQVTVEAGCRLGRDPRDPTGLASWERSLTWQLEQRGWALPDLGGVSHQTVAGFFATGSSGGSCTHAIEDALVGIRFIDGTGAIHDIDRDDARFHALSCSMGLCGVVSRLTLQCIPRYDIMGREDATTERGCRFDLMGDGPSGIGGFFRRTEYARLMWWPQPGVRRLTAWQARRMTPADYDDTTGTPDALRRLPYRAMTPGAPDLLAEPLSQALQAAGGAFYDAIETARSLRWAVGRRLPRLGPALAAGGRAMESLLIPAALRGFVPVDVGGPQRFRDAWWQALPMDNQMSEKSLPTTFTEVWLPLERAGEAMRTLGAMFERGGLAATGHYIVEVYAARETRGWLHPGYQRDSLRIDVFWFERSRRDAHAFFGQFWDALAPFDYRLHWGKHVPRGDAIARYLAQRYPRWRDFLALRRELDPQGIFLNRHFRDVLAVTDHAPARPSSPFVRPTPAPSDAPLSARLRSSLEGLARERALGLPALTSLYAPHAVYRDPISESVGVAQIEVRIARWLQSHRSIGFSDFDLTGDDGAFTLSYVMHWRDRGGALRRRPVASVCRAVAGQIVSQVDYYDTVAGFTSASPAAASLHRALAERALP